MKTLTSGYGRFHTNEPDPKNPDKKLTPYRTGRAHRGARGAHQMSHHNRLAKLESRIPPPAPVRKLKPAGGLVEALAKIKAKSAWLKTAKPIELYRHWQAEIEASLEIIAKGPTIVPDEPGDLPGFAQSLVNGRVAGARSGLQNAYWNLREAENALLKEAGYPVNELENAHRHYSHLPWQWPYKTNLLPEAAQRAIDAVVA